MRAVGCNRTPLTKPPLSMCVRDCFYATMLKNTVIKVTFGDLRAQQISAIIFQCGVLYHTEFGFLGLFIHLRLRKNDLKYAALLINIFIL